MTIFLTDEAIFRFEMIIDHLMFHAGNAVADKISAEIWEGIDMIAASPYLGQVEPWLEYYGLSHKRWIVGNYKIVYKIERDAIFVTDIFDTRQDPTKMLP